MNQMNSKQKTRFYSSVNGQQHIKQLEEQQQGNPPIKTFNIVFIGNQGAGKTSIISRYLNNHFNKNQQCTEAVKSTFVIKKYEKQYLRICFHDTPGQRMMIPLVDKYLQLADVIVLVVSKLTEEIWKVIKQERLKKVQQHQIIFIFANKQDKAKTQQDKEQLRQKLITQYEKLRDDYDLLFFQMGSARSKKNQGINFMMENILSMLASRQQQIRKGNIFIQQEGRNQVSSASRSTVVSAQL